MVLAIETVRSGDGSLLNTLDSPARDTETETPCSLAERALIDDDGPSRRIYPGRFVKRIPAAVL